MFKSIFSKFYYSQREPTSPDQTRTLVFASGDIPDAQIITATARQNLMTSLGSEGQPTITSERKRLGEIIKNVINKINIFVGKSIEWSHYQSGKADENIGNNLNSENPDPKLLEEVNRYRQNFVATALAQARLGRNQPENFLETYRPYFSITEIPDQAAQRIKDIIKNVIRDCMNKNQEVNDNLTNAIANQIVDELKQLKINSEDSQQMMQIQQILQDSDWISNLEQVVREILSYLGQINPQEAQQSEQTSHQAGLDTLDTIIERLKIVVATQPLYSAGTQANQENFLQQWFKQNLKLPIPASWIIGPTLAVLLMRSIESNTKLSSELIRMAISGSVGAVSGFADGWQRANELLKIAVEAQAANNPDQPLAREQELYPMISAKNLFEKIQNTLTNSDPTQPESIQELLRQIHLIRILWNEYQYPILKNDLDRENLGTIQNLAGQHEITLDPRESPLVFYRNLLLLVEVLGIELIQKIQQSTQSESNLSLNPETFWHQTGLNGLREVVNQKVKEINRALGGWRNRGFYLSEASRNAFISALLSLLSSEMTRYTLNQT